ncbi:unnamed protein product, partial [Mesorhabditis spiculigera]
MIKGSSDANDDANFGDGEIDRNMKIMNGQARQIRDYPYMVSIQRPNPRAPNVSSQAHHCGGSLIGLEWVLSAAHCFFHPNGKREDASLWRVMVGSTFWKLGGPNDTLGQTRFIKEVHIAPNYELEGDEDVALVRLESPVTLNANVHPIELWTKIEHSQMQKVEINGWGRVNSTSNRNSQKLLGYQTRIMKPREGEPECEYRKIYCFRANLNGSRSSDCQGDSGGPIAAKLTKQGVERWVQVSMVNYGMACDPGYPPRETQGMQ